MPTSRSPKPGTRPGSPRPARHIGPLAGIGVTAVVLIAIIAAPASLLNRWLPLSVHADDFSGTLWHGSAGKITWGAHDVGAVEWRLHPTSLLTLAPSADVHWVLVGFVADALVGVDRQGLTARNVEGSGPIEDLGALGIAAGWHGLAHVKVSRLAFAFGPGPLRILAAVGEVNVSGLGSAGFADGADLGGYTLSSATGAVTADGEATTQLTDTGGPLEVQAVIQFSSKDRTGLLSGTVRSRPNAPEALRAPLDSLANLHPRDAQGRIPVDLEVAL